MRTKIFVLVAVVIASASPMMAAAEAFTAPLSGSEEVPPVDTMATGNAIVRVVRIRGDESVNYTLITAGLAGTVAAHIHCAPEDANGPVGVTLFLGAPAMVNGILASGPIMAPDENNGCLWVDIFDVVAAIESGDTYVNVHTLPNLGGEIRGQLR